MRQRDFAPIHPGEILLEEFLRPMEISQYRLSKDISVDPRRINEIIHGKRSISADTALRLGRHFGTSARFWLNLQAPQLALESLCQYGQEGRGHPRSQAGAQDGRGRSLAGTLLRGKPSLRPRLDRRARVQSSGYSGLAIHFTAPPKVLGFMKQG